MARALDRLMRPRSIAVFGSVWAENVITQCENLGFDGEIWPVHPSRQEIAGRRCFPSIDALPEAPDASFVGINRRATIEVIEKLSDKGAGGAICFASGWAETGDHDLQASLLRAAGEMPILGPNCYGIINMLDRAVIWPDQHGTQPCESGAAIISQSSNIAINLTMQARGLPVAYVACLGNAAQIGMAELAEFLVGDDRVTCLGIYAEGFDDPSALAALAHKARGAGKGIVVLKSGKTEAGAAAAASHTASMAGSHAASKAFLKQAGISEVETLAELIETLKILHVNGNLAGKNICSLSCSGGEAGLVADLARHHDLEFAPLDTDQERKLGDILGPLVTLSNPLDYHTFIWGDLDKTTAVFTETLRPYDAGLFLIDPPRSDRCDPSSFEPALQAIAAAHHETRKPAFAVASMPENFQEDRIEALMEAGVTALCGLETSLAAIEAAATAPPIPGWSPWPAFQERDVVLINEARAKQMLEGAGIAVPRNVTATSLEELAERAETLKKPLVLKGLGFAHKSEMGAVRLGVHDVRSEPEMIGATGYLAEEMIENAVAELIIGFRRDPVYGATVMLGFGGVQAELLHDVVTLVCPVSATDIQAALSGLKLFPLLQGYRGGLEGDVDAIIECILSIQTYFQNQDTLEEIEINPLMVLSNGVVAVDALIKQEKT